MCPPTPQSRRLRSRQERRAGVTTAARLATSRLTRSKTQDVPDVTMFKALLTREGCVQCSMGPWRRKAESTTTGSERLASETAAYARILGVFVTFSYYIQHRRWSWRGHRSTPHDHSEIHLCLENGAV